MSRSGDAARFTPTLKLRFAWSRALFMELTRSVIHGGVNHVCSPFDEESLPWAPCCVCSSCLGERGSSCRNDTERWERCFGGESRECSSS